MEAEVSYRVAGIDSIVFGLGSLELVHATNEYAEIDDVMGTAHSLLGLMPDTR